MQFSNSFQFNEQKFELDFFVCLPVKFKFEIPYSREQKHVSISDTPMLLIEINSISNMGRQK